MRWRPGDRRRRALKQRREICRRKGRYATWEDARLAAMEVWRESPRPVDANPGLPYTCDLVGEKHYHFGHLRFRKEPAA